MIEHCTRCLMPSSRPRVVFKDGICNACWNSEEKETIDWDQRANEFAQLIEENKTDGPYDCVVPFSGGKDSASIAHRLKFQYDQNPLLVCYGQLMQTEEGRHNLEEVSKQGFDIFYWRVNQDVSRKLARRFLIERGAPKTHYNAGVNSVPVITAKNFGIPLIWFAEFGEAEFGGLVLDEESKRTRNLTEVLEHQIGDHPLNWISDEISERDLAPYIYPENPGVTAHYWSYYHRWDNYENYEYCRDNMNFKTLPRSDGNFVGWDSIDDCIDDLDYHMMRIKFSFGRSVRQASRMIQQGHLTREEGLELCRKYDNEFPTRYLNRILEYLDLTFHELIEIIDSHRNPELWERIDGRWREKYPLK